MRPRKQQNQVSVPYAIQSCVRLSDTVYLRHTCANNIETMYLLKGGTTYEENAESIDYGSCPCRFDGKDYFFAYRQFTLIHLNTGGLILSAFKSLDIVRPTSSTRLRSHSRVEGPICDSPFAPLRHLYIRPVSWRRPHPHLSLALPVRREEASLHPLR